MSNAVTRAGSYAKGKRFMRIGFVISGLLLGTSLVGCATKETCEPLTKCGGDFLAGAKAIGKVTATEWVAAAPDACVDNVPTPPNPASLTLIPPRPAGIRAVEPSTVDWCNGLVLAGDGTIKDYDDGWFETLKQYAGWFPSVPLYEATLTMQQGFQYELTTRQLVTQHADLSPTCLVAQGVKLSCDQVGSQLQSFLEKKFNMVSGLRARVYTTGNAPVCQQTTEDGCSCDYNVALSATTAGPWTSNAGEISFFDFTAAPPAQADYCVSAAGFSLSGTKGADLFNRGSLKTLQFKPQSCGDSVQSKSEEGIDCGGSCPTACSK